MTATGTIERVDAPEPPVPGPRAGAACGSCWSNGEALVTFIVVAACVVFTFKELQPSQLFKNTTPAGGDMGAHVWLPPTSNPACYRTCGSPAGLRTGTTAFRP